MIVKAKKDRELILIRAQNTQNENKAETIEIDVPEEYESYNKKIVFITDDGTVWDVIQNNEYKITNAITKYKQVDFYIWLTKEVNGESIDFRSKTKTLRFYDNIDASDEITPEEIHGVNTVVNLLEDEIDKVENLNITAQKIGTQTTITITKKDGTTQQTVINDGADGQDGRDGQDGQPGQDGQDGQDAKINGKNSIEIEAGNNITIDDTDTGIIINATGGESGGTTDYTDLSNKPKINNVELSGNKSLNDLGIQPSGNYVLKSEIPDVSNFITNSVNNLLNYYLKSETYTKQEVNNLIGQIATLQFQVVATLPQTGDSKYIYLVPSSNPKIQNVKDEYIWVNNAWEQIGSTQVDLTGYATESWVNTQISVFLTQAQIQALISTALSDYALSSDIPTKTSDLTNDSGFITGYTETDPTVPSHVKDITQANITSWNNKGTYSKPSNGIPKTDLASAVQTSLGKADTAIQPSNLATVATSGSYNDLSNKPTIPVKDNYTITNNLNNQLQTVGIVEQNVGNIIKYWEGTQSEYNAITTKDNNTIYYITDAEETYVIDNSYVHTDNNYTTPEKNKLNGIATGAEVNVQANWNETNSSSDAYIQNKPTIPTVNNSTITIQMNGSTVDNFTTNASSGKTINLGTVVTSHQDISGKLDTSKVKNSNSTTAGDVYDVRYINTMIGDVETVLTTLTTGSGV